jgi:glycosyltransferase domain-containing protein
VANNFTLIIPTHNRHHYLKRSIEYYKNLKAEVIYCDSSVNRFDGELNSNIKYIHLPGEIFSSKVLFSLSQVTSNLVALCADDDFIVLDSLYKGVLFLNENEEYKTILGKYISFKEDFDGQYYPLYDKMPDDLNFIPTINAQRFFSNYYQILWGMYYKSNLTNAFRIINNANFNNDNFIEMVIGAYMCHAGGIKFLHDIWGVREISTIEHWGSRHESIFSKKIANKYDDYSKFQKLVDSSTKIGYSDLVLNNYINSQRIKIGVIRYSISKLIPRKLKNIFRKIFKVDSNTTCLKLEKSDIEALELVSFVLTKYNQIDKRNSF